MGSSATKKNFLLWLTLIMLVAGVGVYFIIQEFFPEHYFSLYPAIPLFFYAFGWYYIYIFDHSRKKNNSNALSVYIGTKVVKMLIAMLIMLLYLIFTQSHRADFIIVFFLFYLFSIIYETLYFYIFENNKNKANKTE